MKEEFTKIVEEKHFAAICDVCGYRQIDTWRNFGTCGYCKKHLCRKCFTAVSEDESGDYPKYVYACAEHKEKLLKAFELYQELSNADIPSLDDIIESQKKE